MKKGMISGTMGKENSNNRNRFRGGSSGGSDDDYLKPLYFINMEEGNNFSLIIPE